ncbi:MAG: LysM peptidoglycan-binding domain-containing protein, partial [Anaerolineae bacterium]|nr:LysM peptidoglycan-binding domain-containing protein [Anaerolineae bacterium]
MKEKDAMRHQRLAVVVLLVLLMTTLTVSAQVVTEEPGASQVLPAAPTAQVLPPVAGEITYVVRPGDTLFRIAVRYKTTVRILAEANNIVNPALIFAGQTLRIPGVTPTPT